MDIINNMLLERRLILRSRWTLIAAAVMVAFAVWFGFVGPYQFAMWSEGRLIDIKEQMQEQVEEYAQDITVDMSHAVKQVKADFQVLHPVAGPNRIMSMFAALGPLITAILGAHIVGSEFTKRTVKVRAAHYGWGNSMVAKLISIVFISAIIAAAGFLIGSIGGNIIWNVVISGPSEIAKEVVPPYIPSPHWQQMLLVILGSSFYGILGAFVATATRSPLGGAVAGLSIPFIEQFAVAALSPLRWLPQNIYSNLLVGTFRYFEGAGMGKPLVLETVEPLWLCWLISIGWSLILFFSAWQLSKRQAI
ncbi:ABC transporter permease subunit [Dehalococcoidia bacterium]|nr:ABC transporter permease subunit [Dehalococcoidia bacterium]